MSATDPTITEYAAMSRQVSADRAARIRRLEVEFRKVEGDRPGGVSSPKRDANLARLSARLNKLRRGAE